MRARAFLRGNVPACIYRKERLHVTVEEKLSSIMHVKEISVLKLEQLARILRCG